MNFRVTTLMDNRSAEGLESEHGLSIYVESESVKLLFDTGQTTKFMENAKRLGVKLENLDCVVISHGHYDHSGGLEGLIEDGGRDFELVVGAGFFRDKYKVLENGEYKYIGHGLNRSSLEERGISVKTVDKGMMEIAEGVLLFRDFDNMQDYEKLNENFVLKDQEKYRTDDFGDEIVLGLKTESGIFLILGCSHPGFVNIVETVKARTGEKVIGVLGGTHLVSADSAWLEQVLDYLEKSDIRTVATSHCTGETAEAEISKRIGKRYVENSAGKVIDICHR